MKPFRTRALARIHVESKALGLDDEGRRDMMERVAGQRSAADLDDEGLKLVLDELRRLGSAGAPADATYGRPNNVDEEPLLQKIEALLTDMKLPWKYADAIAKRMFDVDRLQFCAPNEWNAVLIALIRKQEKLG